MPKTAELEYRAFGFEVRTVDDSNTLVGHAAVFNTVADIGGWFREKIAPGAFKKTLADNADVRALLNHNPDKILGRTKAGTLKLREDETGLLSEISMPETTVGRDLMISVKRGDIDQMSFAFQSIQEQWDETDAEHPVRTITEARLFDVSPVTFPAYPTTDVSARSAEAILAEHRAVQPVPVTNEPLQEEHSNDSTSDYATADELRRKQLDLLDIEG
jgi:hypothetical protein